MKIIKRNIKNLMLLLFVFLFTNNAFAITFSEPWEEIEYNKKIAEYENKPYDGHSVFKYDDPYIIYFDGDEPDISDGDLEDKIGDFDIYQDLFPEDYKNEYPEYNDEKNESKVIRQPLNRKEVDKKDVSSFITYRVNGQTVVPVIPEKISAYNPEEVPYLKQLVQTYGEDALTTVLVYWDGKQCRYNKESKLFVIVD